VDFFPDRNERRDALDKRLVQFLLTAGYVPVPIPNDLHLNSSDFFLDRDAIAVLVDKINPQAVLLSGGNDIATCSERDATESWLLDYAEQHQLPLLGICRGMQMMGIWAGAELKSVTGHVCASHELMGKISGEVNSYHNQAIAGCPKDFSVLAHSMDGEIEAIQHQNLPWEGWMWHPEREDPFKSDDVQRLQTLFGD
jgi:putative glutamine amidotransferase